jgi:hypothetical protein
LQIVTAQALVSTHKGDAIATFHQMDSNGKGKSILSCLQMEAHGADINDHSRLLPGGKQRIMIDGYQLPLDFKNGSVTKANEYRTCITSKNYYDI